MNASEFMNLVVTDDVLLEILVRLPDARTAIQSAAVSKRWRSLVLNSDFVRFFTKQQQMNRTKQSVALFFNYSYRSELSFHQLSQSEYYDSECEPCYLSFMPAPPPLPACIAECGMIYNMDPYFLRRDPRGCEFVITACCDDLVLLSSTDMQHFICNWRTKEWVQLPEVPRRGRNHVFEMDESYGHAVVHGGGGSYRVMLVESTEFHNGIFWFKAAIFNTETGRWCLPLLRVPYNFEVPQRSCYIHLEMADTGDGVLHWLEGAKKYLTLVAFDVLASKLRLIPLPADGRFGEICLVDSRDKVRLGVVQGRLWLSQMTKTDDGAPRLRIWELDRANDSWRLVHDATLGCGKKTEMFLLVLAFDPNNDNVIFLLHEKEIFRYEFDRDEYERVCEFPLLSGCDSVDKIKENVTRHLDVLTICHPCWPSSIYPFKNHL